MIHHSRLVLVGRVLVALAVSGAGAAPAAGLTEAQAIAAVERFIAAWNTRDPAAFAATLHYPHARPEAGGGATIYAAPAEYAATVDFAAVEKTGWVRTRLDWARVLQLGPGKAHVAGQWTRLRADGSPIRTNQVTYVVTERDGSIGIQARFSAGTPLDDEAKRSVAADAAVAAVKAYMNSFNSRDDEAWADTLNYPHLRMAGGAVKSWPTRQAYVDEFDFDAFAKRFGWSRSEWESIEAVQVAADAVNVALRATRRDAQGKALSTFDTYYLVTRENGHWGVRARSSFAE
ncbi:MAG TPA: hypothetical protein VHR17_04435 [Thermoanaerobaculia bacterium]|nr:hypothetical protein [Thermoanaerobaculia bacterium]